MARHTFNSRCSAFVMCPTISTSSCYNVPLVGTHYCLAVGNDEGLELDETDEDEELGESNEKEVEEHKGEDVGGIQCGGGRQENSLRDYSLHSRGLIYKYRVVCA